MVEPKYTSWVCAIVTDDFVFVSSKLNTVFNNEKQRLLNGIFENTDLEKIPKKIMGHCNRHVFTVCNPWSLAVSHSSGKVIEVFLAHGVDVFQMDSEGNNAIHKLVEHAFFYPEKEESLTKTYEFLKHNLGPAKMDKLLMMENTDTLRPLELAANLGTFSVLQAILETENVYMKKEELYGINKLQYFDVTEYESYQPNSRQYQSPARLLVFLDQSNISEKNREQTKKAFDSQPISAWLDAKFAASKLYILLWALIRIIFFFMFYFLDFDPVILNYSNINMSHNLGNQNDSKTNASNSDIQDRSPCGGIYLHPLVHLCMLFFLNIASLIVIIYDLCVIIRKLTKRRKPGDFAFMTPGGSKSLILHFSFYRCMQFVTCVSTFCMLTMVGTYVFISPFSVNTWAYLLMSVSSVGSVWSLLYFAQVLPNVGYFVISIERMMKNLIQFIFVFLLFHFSFTYAFMKTLRGHALSTICTHHFYSIWKSFYGTFMIMLNMIDLNEYTSADATALFILHCIYVFIVAILLINFLIAMLSSSYSDVSENKDVISRIQAMSLAVVVESRTPTCLWPLSRWLQKRHFVVEGDRLYVTRLVPLK